MRDTPALIAVLTVLIVSGLAFVVFSDDGMSLFNDTESETATSSSATATRMVNLYHYRPQNDINDQGELQCTDAGIVAVQRELPLPDATIDNAINQLLSGDIRQSERQSGIMTEFPLPGVRLIGVMIDDAGVAVIAIDDPASWTGGGSCRASILRSQVEQTALQFPAVKAVRFLPDTLFQP